MSHAKTAEYTDLGLEAARIARARLDVARQMRTYVERAWDAYWDFVAKEPKFYLDNSAEAET